MEARRHKVAGGVVVDGEGRVLLLERNVERDGRIVHEVRLPKGHLDPGETDEAAAMREVFEESGYGHLAIAADLGAFTSEYVHEGRQHIREEHYFLMRLTNPERGAPQPSHAEEALFQPVWQEPAEAEQRLSYPSEREFMRRARQALSRREELQNF